MIVLVSMWLVLVSSVSEFEIMLLMVFMIMKVKMMKKEMRILCLLFFVIVGICEWL